MDSNTNNKFDSKNNVLKITFLEIYPSINELVKPKEDFNIIFQGNDNFFDFKKFLSSKTPIQLSYNKKSLIITLLKNNNIFATGFFTIRQGEQNIFFNYENNKKSISNKKMNINNLSECIKIKIFCETETISTISTNNRNTINTNYENNSNPKYMTKVNLMKPIRINNYKNKINQKIYDKKKRVLNSIHQTTNNSMKKNFVNDSKDFEGDYTAILTEEMINFKQNFNSNNNYDLQKMNKIISNTARKNESSNSKGLNRINKAKSKNFLSNNKKQNKNYGKHIKMNNSSLNLINQNNKIISSDISQINNNISNNRNFYTNRNSLKSNNTSFIRTSKRNTNTQNLTNKAIRTSLNNYISGKILEHVNSNEKINYISINKNLEKNTYNNDTKKIKPNNNNITMNSISTTFTKKNEMEYSMNSLQDYDDKNMINNSSKNKNTFRPFTNRTNNERLSKKISEDKNNKILDNTNRNLGKHKYNKSLCQKSFTEKIFCENNEKLYNLCKSETKLKVNYNEINELKNNNNININIEDKEQNISISNNNNYIEEEEIDMDNNFTKLKEDFNLLYNLEYISKINEDLLKLEVELFIEKMSELFNAYHTQMDEKILEKKLIDREYKANFGKYILYNKLKENLGFIKRRLEKEKNKNISITQYKENTKTNIKEIDIFKIIFPGLINKENKNEKLKNILSIILKNKENQELIGEKYDKIKAFI